MRLTGRPPAGTCLCAACRDARLAVAIFAVGALDKLLTIVAVARPETRAVTAQELAYTALCWPVPDYG